MISLALKLILSSWGIAPVTGRGPAATLTELQAILRSLAEVARATTALGVKDRKDIKDDKDIEEKNADAKAGILVLFVLDVLAVLDCLCSFFGRAGS